MKKFAKIMFGMMVLSGLLLLVSCGESDDKTESGSLSEEETEDLLHLREEEKLARDVYLYAYDKYGIAIFQNISDSEQTHMGQVLDILQKYDLEDSADEKIGVFNNSDLQNLYDQLTAKVDTSEMDALVVGATIEDLDIKDISEFLDRTEKEDLTDMYESLMCGSRNHLRSFYSQITSDGGSYSPAYISQSEFDSIVNSDTESCN